MEMKTNVLAIPPFHRQVWQHRWDLTVSPHQHALRMMAGTTKYLGVVSN